ncbi:uncharacterized protein LOC120455736 [Drosophila santomea]|uniref:uncharacterized protein LOC120455736 n=1 Tax=Drosophila santomea TaxID=129105 RepID=UPI001CCC1C35|nr:uncharacterized protein LOC120455736 [Drosophila santomea]
MSLTDQNVKIKADYEVYNLLSLETSTEKKTIVFEIKIPILSPNNYTLYQIVTIPFNGTEIVNLPKFILEDRIELKTLNTNCIRVNDLSVCETPTDPDNPECIHNLLANKTATCTVVETITQTRIYSPIEGLLVILNARDVNMTSDCIPSKSLSGSFIINHDSCSITINGTKYADATVTMTDRWQMDITKTNDVKTMPAIEPINLQQLHLSTLKTKWAINTMQSKAADHLTTIYILIASSIVLAIAAWIWRKDKIIYATTSLPTTGTPAIPSLWPSFRLEGGGVIGDGTSMPSPPPKPPRAATYI